MEYRKQAKAEMAAKISRLTSDSPVKVDASDWKPSSTVDLDKKLGPAPKRRAYKSGGKVEAKKEAKVEGKGAPKRADRAKKNVGGGMPYSGGSSVNIPEGQGMSRARQMMTGGFKSGGRTKKAMGGVPGAPMAARMPTLPAQASPRATAALAARPMARKDGGKVDPHAELDNGSAVEMIAPKVMRGGKGDKQPTMDKSGMSKMSGADPYEDRPLVEPAYADGGGVTKDVGEAVGHAIAAYHRMQERHARKSGGRVNKANGGGFGEAMNNPKSEGKGKSKGKSAPTINITINTAPKQPAMPPMLGAPPMPPGPPPGPEMASGPGPAPTIGAPPAPGPNPMMALGAGGPPPPPGPGGRPFKRGGAVKMDAGAGSGVGRLEKIEAYGDKA